MSLQVIDRGSVRAEVVYGGAITRSTEEKMGTRYVLVGVRMLVDPTDPEDVEAGPRAAGCDQGRAAGGPARFEVPNWDHGEPEEGARCAAGARRDRARLRTRSARKDEVDPVRHLIGTAVGLGRQSREGRDLSQRHARPERRQDDLQARRQATCRSTGSGRSASTTPRAIFQKNQYNAYSLNSITAKKNADGSVAIQFGGCDGKIPTACRSCRAGTTRCGSIARALKSSAARGNFRRRGRRPSSR